MQQMQHSDSHTFIGIRGKAAAATLQCRWNFSKRMLLGSQTGKRGRWAPYYRGDTPSASKRATKNPRFVARSVALHVFSCITHVKVVTLYCGSREEPPRE